MGFWFGYVFGFTCACVLVGVAVFGLLVWFVVILWVVVLVTALVCVCWYFRCLVVYCLLLRFGLAVICCDWCWFGGLLTCLIWCSGFVWLVWWFFLIVLF